MGSVESELLQFVKGGWTTYTNYQPIIIKELLESGSENNYSVPRKQIDAKIKLLNFRRDTFNIASYKTSAYPALDKFVKNENDLIILDSNNFKTFEIAEIIELCDKEIAKQHVEKIVRDENDVYFIQAGKDSVWLDEFKKSKKVGVGYGEVARFDLSDMNKEKIQEITGEKYGTELENIVQIKEGDIVAITQGSKQGIESFAIITSKYYFDSNSTTYPHKVNVEILNFGTNKINSNVRKGIIKSTLEKDKILEFLRGEEAQYFLLRHSRKGKQEQTWRDEIGRKYHVGRQKDGRMGHNVQKLLDTKIGTKAVWWSDTIDRYPYILGHGAIKSFETLTADKDWNVVFHDFVMFEGEKDTGTIGKKMSGSILEQIQALEKEGNLNWQHSINTIPKKLYQEMIGEDLSSDEAQRDTVNQSNFDPTLERLYKILERKKQIIFYGPPGTGKTHTAKKLKKYILSKNTPQPISSDSQFWIYSVDPDNWQIVKTHHIWATSIPIEKISERIKQNDYVIFFVTGTRKFQGIFKFSSDWYTAKNVVWPDETNEIRYLSQIKLEPVLLGDLNLWDIADKLEYFPDPENKRDSSLKLQGKGGYPSNKESLSRKDFEILCSHMRTIGTATNEQNFSNNVTFHQSYSYEDFVEGIRPEVTSSDKVIYKPQDGIFKEICESARKDSQNKYVLIIDEINRGNVSKIFGELITLIESDKRKEEHEVTLPYTRQTFWIPENLFIIGTMNTADRSIAQLDTALRRRFAFEELMPEYSLIDKSIKDISIKNLLTTLNSRIRSEGPQFRDKQIGHSYFMGDCKNIEDLRTIFAVEIIPLLQDYFYHDYKKLEDKILNSDFIDSSKDEIKPDWKNNDEIFKAAINKILTSN